MIRALLKKQLLELGAAFVRSSKTGKRRSRAGAFGYALLFAALMLLVMLNFGSMALPLAVTLVPQGLDWLYFVLMELSALTVSVLASAFTSYGHLFRCRDNQQLLALPIPPGAIFAVRCGGVYLTGLIYLLLAWVPSVVCYALAAPRPGGALLAALPVALALAGVSMVLAVLLGWAVALLNRRARHKSLVTVVGTLLFLAVYYAVFQWVGNAVEALAVDAVQAGATAGRAAAPLHLLGLAAVGNVPALLLLLALAAACMALCGKALAKPYLRLLTLEPGRAKAEYRAKTQKKQPPRRALLRRELLHLGACPMWLLNCALSSLLLPVLGVAVLWKAAALRAFTAAYPPESLPMLVCGMVCAIAAMNFITAPSVSLEGGHPLAAAKPAGCPAAGSAGKDGAAIAAHAAGGVVLRRVRHGGAAHSGRAGAAGACRAGSLCVADGANGPCLGIVPAQPPLGQRSCRGQAERRQYAGDVRRVAAGGRGAVFAPDLTGLRCAAAGRTDCLSGCAAGAGFAAAPLAVHPRRSPVCRPALKWEKLY